VYRDNLFQSSLDREQRGGVHNRILPGRTSFFFHLRPRQYPASAIRFSNTCYLGFFTTLFLAVEILTGMLLMVYYTPTPNFAYQSIQNLALVPFGKLLRDLHRLAGDLLVLSAFLHMARVAVSGSYKGPRRSTWLTGSVLFFLILALAFSGYLLPWDQLSFWAVTVGTGLFGELPGIGSWLMEILRGGQEMGADGLLRFYVLHVVLLPLVVLPLLAVHYYRVARLHGISLPVCTAARRNSDDLRPVPLWPTVVMRELQVASATVFLLIAIVAFAYDAPLGAPANPLHTPAHIEAPWFFLWAQGLLRICPATLPALALIVTPGLLILFLPWYDGTQRRSFGQRPRFALALIISLCLLLLLTFLGARLQQPGGHSPETLLDTLVPVDGRGPLHTLAYDELTLGVHTIGGVRADAKISSGLLQLLTLIDSRLRGAVESQGISESSSVLIVEAIQPEVKRITLRQSIRLKDSPTPRTFERTVYRHGFGGTPLLSGAKK
jgi:quinol-cytochrome oxidoreductase complex cytochrome b subunit